MSGCGGTIEETPALGPASLITAGFNAASVADRWHRHNMSSKNDDMVEKADDQVHFKPPKPEPRSDGFTDRGDSGRSLRNPVPAMSGLGERALSEPSADHSSSVNADLLPDGDVSDEVFDYFMVQVAFGITSTGSDGPRAQQSMNARPGPRLASRNAR